MTEQELEQEESGYSYKAMIKRDQRRWANADLDDDGVLDKAQFTDFLHPEESERMRDVVVLETMEDIDKDKVLLIVFRTSYKRCQLRGIIFNYKTKS